MRMRRRRGGVFWVEVRVGRIDTVRPGGFGENI